MPTITTALAIDSLFQHNTNQTLTNKPPPPPPPPEKPETLQDPATRPSSQRFHFSPALYATPALAPIPDVSSIILSPTNYVVNYKRRGARPCAAAAGSRVEEFVVMPEADSSAIVVSGDSDVFDDFGETEVCGNGGSDVEDGGSCGRLGKELGSSSRCQDDYYDTADDFFSDGSASNSSPTFRNTENELHVLRLSLIEESSRREVAEDKLLHLNNQYMKLLNCLSHSISSFPKLPNLESLNPTDLCQEIVVLKFISEALEAEMARDETEGVFKGIIASKDQEISRLRDRMQYYEAMNREMSQRNQEAADLARKRRQRRSRMHMWIWGCVGLSITAGASLLAYSYLPPHHHQNHHQDTSSSAPTSSVSTTGAE